MLVKIYSTPYNYLSRLIFCIKFLLHICKVTKNLGVQNASNHILKYTLIEIALNLESYSHDTEDQ